VFKFWLKIWVIITYDKSKRKASNWTEKTFDFLEWNGK